MKFASLFRLHTISNWSRFTLLDSLYMHCNLFVQNRKWKLLESISEMMWKCLHICMFKLPSNYIFLPFLKAKTFQITFPFL